MKDLITTRIKKRVLNEKAHPEMGFFMSSEFHTFCGNALAGY
ncbi:hypothetical protein V2I75_10125 [Pseudomonas viridiflava]|nr:hypothetical protein [Pseudomonas viridiflava]MEE4157642.1 hypothetical protein [Pseudomonas viridiflava]